MSDTTDRNKKTLADVNVSNVGLFLAILFIVVCAVIALASI